MIGIKVEHSPLCGVSHGIGTILGVSDDTVKVDFPTAGTKKFGFPKAFDEGRLAAVEPADQQAIDDYIKKFKEEKLLVDSLLTFL